MERRHYSYALSLRSHVILLWFAIDEHFISGAVCWLWLKHELGELFRIKWRIRSRWSCCSRREFWNAIFTMRSWSVVMAWVTFLAMAMTNAQAQPSPSYVLPDYKCSESITKLPAPAIDPCTNTTAYGELGSCSSFMSGNDTTVPAECCTSVQKVLSNFPACFCKVTFQSKFPGAGPALARARPLLCNVTDDLCSTCPAHFGHPIGNLTANDCFASIAAKSKLPVTDPCGNTPAYSELGSCAGYMAGNTTTPTPECCTSVQDVWSKYPACFCKVTFFSKFPGLGPSFARARPQLCSITDDICHICPAHLGNVATDLQNQPHDQRHSNVE